MKPPLGCPIPGSSGHVLPKGPLSAPIAFMAEAAGQVEAVRGEPLVGPAGGELDRWLQATGIERSQSLILNRHLCFPGDTLVEASAIYLAYRSVFSGIIVEAITDSGVLSGTSNHPVLTQRGWVALGKVEEGDYLVRSFLRERVTNGDPYIYSGPSSAEEVYNTLAVHGITHRMAHASVDFNGEGEHSEVDVVTSNRLLPNGKHVRSLKPQLEDFLTNTSFTAATLQGHSSIAPGQGDATGAMFSSAPGCMCRLSEFEPSLSPQLAHPVPQGSGSVSNRDSSFHEIAPDLRLSSLKLGGQSRDTGPCVVGFAKVSKINRRPFSGHVYNLHTDSNHYSANGFLVHNCHPPNDWLIGAPWERAAAGCSACLLNLENTLGSWSAAGGGGKVLVTLGGTALRSILNLPRARGKDPVKLENFHGAPSREPGGRFWVVPTYHPSYLLRGGNKFTQVVLHDLMTAKELAEGSWKLDEPELIIDPPVEWFDAWAQGVIEQAQQDPEGVWLSVDVETPDKGRKADEGELSEEDASYEILYINLSTRTDEGVTVPWQGPYITIAKRLLEQVRWLGFWNAPYDVPRLRKAGVGISWGQVRDWMNFWHILQSNLPRGLGFVAPFYSRLGPWKHLGNLSGTYRALDGVQTTRCAWGIYNELRQQGMWETASRYCYDLDVYALRPAEAVGLPVNREAIERDFRPMLQKACREAVADIQAIAPREIRVLEPKQGLTREVELTEKQKEEGYELVECPGEIRLIRVCQRCKAEDVSSSHVCEDLKKVKKEKREEQPQLAFDDRPVTRWYRREPFNPASWQQVLSYIKWKGHKPGRNKKTRGDTTDKKTLERLRKTGDPFYGRSLDFRQAAKMEGTYGEGVVRRLDWEGRLHTQFTHVPSTQRLSSVAPNLTNLAHHVKFAPEFRRTIEARPGCKLVKADFSAIEAVETGWFCNDPEFMRLAKLSIHAYHASTKLGIPADLKWSDADLKAHFKEIKDNKEFEGPYNASKRCVYLTLYGGTPQTMYDLYPEFFPSKRAAEADQGLLYELCPKLLKWHNHVREKAHRLGYLGGPGDHPFGFKHYFYAVLEHRRVGGKWKQNLGQDAKKCVAFYPQSTAAGAIFEATLRLFHPESPSFIGDLYFGETPLRALIHDEIFLEVPEEKVDFALERLVLEMTRPIVQQPCPKEWGFGPYLQIGVEAKVGKNWADVDSRRKIFDDGNPEGMTTIGVEDLAADVFYEIEEEDEEVA